jgi:hypothetical protein
MCIEGREYGCCNCPYYIKSCEYCVISQEFVDNSVLFIKELEKNYGIRIDKYNKE